MSDTYENQIFIDSVEFGKIVKVGLSFAFPSKKWWMHRRRLCLGVDDMADPLTLLPVIAGLAEERWAFIGPATGTSFSVMYHKDDRCQFDYGITGVVSTSRQVAGIAVMAGICLCDMPVGNLDPVVEAFIRTRELKEASDE